jgi:hypothetical protein
MKTNNKFHEEKLPRSRYFLEILITSFGVFFFSGCLKLLFRFIESDTTADKGKSSPLLDAIIQFLPNILEGMCLIALLVMMIATIGFRLNRNEEEQVKSSKQTK